MTGLAPEAPTKPCTRCGKCCEELPCGLAPVHRGKCVAYGKRKGIATCYLAKESMAIRELLRIGKGCDDVPEDETIPAQADEGR